MFNKSSTLNNKINNRLNSIKIQKLLADPNFTKLTILTLSSCLVTYLILPCNTQILINSLLKHPLIVSSLIVFCLIISLINMPVGISLLVFLGAIYFGQSGYLSTVCKNESYPRTDNVVEGFKSKSYKDDIKDKDDEITSKITNLFGDGPFSKSIDEYKKARKELIEEDMAEENMNKYEVKVSNSRNKNKRGKGKRNKENFGNTGKKVEKFQSIPMRKFNPADKDDTNLLLVMEHCKDIQSRIEYEYEDITYLKKYIKDKLEKIIDLLDLVEDE